MPSGPLDGDSIDHNLFYIFAFPQLRNISEVSKSICIIRYLLTPHTVRTLYDWVYLEK